MCNFRIGQKVCAIVDLDCGVEKGEIFTISRITFDNYTAYDGVGEFCALTFKERVNRPGYAGFDVRFFRPLVERKTDISIFKAMLTPKTEQVPA